MATKVVKKVNAEAVNDLVSKKLGTQSQKAKMANPPQAVTPKEKVTKAVKEQAKKNLVEGVISQREVKYLYPSEITDTLSRKKWRQEVRSKLHKMELEFSRIEDKQSKEFLKAKRAYDAYRKMVVKAEAKVA